MSHRLKQVNELVKRELSQIILREVSFVKDVLVTLTRVDSSPDLKGAKVFVSVFPEKESQKALQALNLKVYDIQQQLNKRLEMKQIPKIRFLEEKEVREAGRIEELLAKIKKEQ